MIKKTLSILFISVSVLFISVLLFFIKDLFKKKKKKIPDTVSHEDVEIEKTLVLSTGHITKKEMDLLGADPDHVPKEDRSPYLTDPYEYGVIIHLCDPDEDKDKLTVHTPEFANLIKLARKYDCDNLKLDADGPTYPGLPTYDW